MTYFFVLGNNPTLSIAEIINVLFQYRIRIVYISEKILCINADKKLDVRILQKQLGGTIKIGHIINTFKLDDIEKPKQSLIKQILQLLPLRFKKVFFGFSIYKGRVGIKALALAIKNSLKQQGISSRWVVSKEKILSSVVVQKNKLLTKGAEFVFLVKDASKVLLGKTITCQEFEKYSFYDFSRPYRAIEKGMIPPKLAKIMINLAHIDLDSIVLDPFCGSGTIIQQALLMGYRNVLGTDIDQNAVDNSNKNLQWLVKNHEFKTKNKELSIEIRKCDVKKLDKKIKFQSVDAIITEPYLGPLRFKISDLKFQIDKLSNFYIKAFDGIKKVLKPDGRVVIIFPVFNVKNKLHFLPILNKLKENGWYIQSIFPDYLLKNQTIKVSKRNSIIYSRPDQKVLREILIFTLCE